MPTPEDSDTTATKGLVPVYSQWGDPDKEFYLGFAEYKHQDGRLTIEIDLPDNANVIPGMLDEDLIYVSINPRPIRAK